MTATRTTDGLGPLPAGDVRHLVIGPAEHGVVRFGRRLAELMGGPLLHRPGPGDLDDATLAAFAGPGPVTVHLQYTDALYAAHTTEAAEVFVALRARIAAPVSVTLHDLPDPADEPGRYRRRAGSYARIARAVDAVVVSSNHELGLLTHLLDAAPATGGAVPPRQVVPLPIEPAALLTGPERPAPHPEVAVFGFVYPGKGHDEVLTAMSALPPAVSFTALGRPADGHDALITTLAATAHRTHRTLDVTGFVPDHQLTERLRRVAVPVAPARMISASGSINTWIGAGRRPLVAAGPYTRELAERYPGSVQLYRPVQLPELIRRVLAEPGLSWLPDPVPDSLGEPGVARAYRSFLTRAGVAQ